VEFSKRVFAVLTGTREAYRDIAGEPRTEEGVLLVSFYVVLTGLGTLASSSKVTSIIEGADLPQGFSMGGEDMAVFMMMGAMFATFIMWFIVAAFVRGISAAFGGRGNYRLALQAAAYSVLPLIATSAVIAVLYHLSSPYTVTTTLSGLFSVSMDFSPAYYADPYLPWVSVLGIIGPVLCAPLWLGALREVERLPLNRAVGALVLLYAIFYGITFGLGILAGI